MPAGVHVQPRYTLRTELLHEAKRMAADQGVTLGQWIVSAMREKMAREATTRKVG